MPPAEGTCRCRRAAAESMAVPLCPDGLRTFTIAGIGVAAAAGDHQAVRGHGFPSMGRMTAVRLRDVGPRGPGAAAGAPARRQFAAVLRRTAVLPHNPGAAARRPPAGSRTQRDRVRGGHGRRDAADAFVELVGRWTLEVHGLGPVIVLDASGANVLVHPDLYCGAAPWPGHRTAPRPGGDRDRVLEPGRVRRRRRVRRVVADRAPGPDRRGGPLATSAGADARGDR